MPQHDSDAVWNTDAVLGVTFAYSHDAEVQEGCMQLPVDE